MLSGFSGLVVRSMWIGCVKSVSGIGVLNCVAAAALPRNAVISCLYIPSTSTIEFKCAR